jgi:hypothetical protein
MINAAVTSAEFLLAFFLNSADFAAAFPENYESPLGGFYFVVHDNSPIVQVKII